MKKDDNTILPWAGKPETLKVPVVPQEEQLERIEQDGLSAMDSLKKSAKRLVECLEKSHDTEQVVDISNSLAGTIKAQTGVVRALLDFKRFMKGN